MGKLIALVGKSASGKSSIEKLLEKRGLIRVISTTTRPMRDGEQEGVDYHYVTENEFLKSYNNGDLLEYSTYINLHYGIDKNYNQIDLSKNNYICVIEPTGYEQLVETVGKENIICFYIWVDDKERLLRSLYREKNPDCKEICRRFLSDINLFSNFENEADYSIENKNVYDATDTIMDIIEFWNTADYRKLVKKQEEDLHVGDKVKIIKILNTDKAGHLQDYINREGHIFSWIIEGGEKKYKVMFEDQDTAYFRFAELELLEGYRWES